MLLPKLLSGEKMGPNKNTTLFHVTVEADQLRALSDENVRRALVSPILSDLANEFDKVQTAPNPVTDPALLLRLHGLSQVQLSNMGIAGFDPSRVINREELVRVRAVAAPHHDEYTSDTGLPVQTRLLRIYVPDEAYGEKIQVFALNLFTPDLNTDTITLIQEGADEERTQSGIIVVTNDSKVVSTSPITGEVVAFAVRNSETGDAKLYTVAIRSIDPSTEANILATGVSFTQVNEAVVALPGGHVAHVKVLTGEVRNQMVEELNNALVALKQSDRQILSEEELAATKAPRLSDNN